MCDSVLKRSNARSSMTFVLQLQTFVPPFTTQKDAMNKDQIQGTVKDLAGQAQEAAGKVIDNKEMQLKGLQKQVVGSAEKAIGDAKQGIKNFSDALKHAAEKP